MLSSPVPAGNQSTINTTTVTSSSIGRFIFPLLATLALMYALLAGLRTVSDPDLFWQLTSGRWVVQHHHVFSTDVFSYTAHGQPWIYPVGSGMLFYAAYLIGGYALISWMGAAACVGTVALLLRRGSAVSAGIALVAVPTIAVRSAPRAEMFTLVLFAAYLSILWQNHQSGRAPLWLLPLLMIAWVNLHLGFVAGLSIIFAFVGVDLLETFFPGERRREAVRRLQRSALWFGATALATMVNPWGWGIYSALVRQSRAMALHWAWITEWGSVPLNWSAVAAVFSLRSPKGTFYLLLAIAAIAVLVALFERQLGLAILLLSAIYAGVQHVRMDALTGCVVVVVGGSLLFLAVQDIRTRIPNERIGTSAAAAVVTLLALLASVRSVDLVTNRRNHGMSQFGAGLSWWFPERAAQFVDREKLPKEIFNTYDEGGYIAWRLGPNYRDYIDGRALPFGPEGFQHQAELMSTSPDSELWQREADRYSINTIILPLARFQTWGPALRTFCRSTDWRPVYLDEVSVVFVRRKPETADLINRLQLDCWTAPLPAGPLLQSSEGSFNQWANAATVLADLGRKLEALSATYNAFLIFPDDSFMRWLRGNIFYAMGVRSVAEREYLAGLSVDPDSAALWFSLATVYKDEGDIPKTIHAQRRGIELSSTPQPLELVRLAGLYLDIQQPKVALDTFDKAVRSAPADILGASGEHSFRYHVALGRAAAWRSLGDTKRASYFEEEAIRDLVPQK